ncbi:hypothetical protein Pmar_PMAR017948 [Perkinsus marinus ATCC 50983]|uniref:Integrase catalytic domain-containing protein n=1 Tax=Perkinsus marinus (strain ATCC 50983 / TXsc) TaxID=423536 RepID=C5L1E2_PERM5|nr:hypothetical protein Pmar_PMAR017948 [Perkinsus marinus ATCC 50983]EER09451.1 hypothetical protein Pmar_PMAR017948 [Perkinsus marinus ATCC 50983]|eukprot:XP_002777635.1 hypothetical protein Pmar_PMAR017948 [Perkinsus marinus ATCC 50983]
MFKYNTAIHSSTGYSPFMLMFGREPPADFIPTTSAYSSLVFDTETYGQYVARVRAYLDDEVDQAVTHAAARYKAFYDRKAKPTAFFSNARVFITDEACAPFGSLYSCSLIKTVYVTPAAVYVVTSYSGGTTRSRALFAPVAAARLYTAPVAGPW